MLVAGRTKQISLAAVIAGMPETLLEAGIKRNRVERHLDIHRGRELGAHAAHALAGGSLALRRFPLDDQNVAAARSGEVIRNARSDNSSADDDHIRRLHGLCFSLWFLVVNP